MHLPRKNCRVVVASLGSDRYGQLLSAAVSFFFISYNFLFPSAYHSLGSVAKLYFVFFFVKG